MGNDCSQTVQEKLATLTKMGTSMAAPVAAGLAALARNYLGESLRGAGGKPHESSTSS